MGVFVGVQLARDRRIVYHIAKSYQHVAFASGLGALVIASLI